MFNNMGNKAKFAASGYKGRLDAQSGLMAIGSKRIDVHMTFYEDDHS